MTLKKNTLNFTPGFCVSKKYKMNDALEPWREWYAWHNRIKIHDINASEIEDLLSSGKLYWHGVSKKGNPVLYMKGRKFMGGNSFERIMKYFLYVLNKGLHIAENLGKVKVNLVIDRTKIDDSEASPSSKGGDGMGELIKDVADMLEKYFPEKVE
eukprot:CAMPEP_0114596398 /NCGR_PEP_ID=MMETSP0125-20121206/18384_1 /TAXON_ID=485358 ORGANISM="Aristerostoma sp., Strain ATCC 50986" /NCGR_SAMPLE_ID=MMETSP0125 /ASSEMBLY_ACC=CAM_ASM_000245 /LENGTH=154 /DNA_ID=CAMNT_0001799321 /DNA_START=74 /DNA_END=538 /DNA_ORIENTATION=-